MEYRLLAIVTKTWAGTIDAPTLEEAMREAVEEAKARGEVVCFDVVEDKDGKAEGIN